ncbi:MAG: putative collagen-binding domain-containing protein [Tepidisphaerales bacterium]
MFIVRVLSALCLVLPALNPLAQHARPVCQHPDNPHYLLFRDKPAVLITSGEHYGAVLNGDFDFIPYLDEQKDKGLNLTRTFSGTYRENPNAFGITDNTLSPVNYVCPWVIGPNGKYDLTRFNPTYWERLKNFIGEAGKRGIVVEYVLFCTLYNDDLWKINPLHEQNNSNGIGKGVGRREVFTLQHKEITAVQEAFVRKAAAELRDFDNVYFEICNEPYFENVTDQWQAHIAQTLADDEKDQPTKHLIAQNIANGKKKVDKPNPLVSILNFHYATPPDTVDENYATGRVIGDDETGFRGKDDVLYRTEGWEFILAGGAIYSSLDYSFTPKTPTGTLRDYKSPGGGSPELRQQLGHLRRFIEGFDFVNLKPMNGIIRGGQVTMPLVGGKTQNSSVRILGQEGKAYAIYIRGGTSARLELDVPSGNYTVQWLSPRTGQWEKTDNIEATGFPMRIASPNYTEDIAAKVVRQ